jgi:hypothetical protein
MAGHVGNTNGIAIKDPELRQIAYASYCSHLAAGHSKKSWYFEHPDGSCVYETMEKYIKDEMEFDPAKKRIAECKGYQEWEKVVEGSARGTNKDANTATLQMVMRNKYGWDKQDNKLDDNAGIDDQSHDKLMQQLSQAQQIAAKFAQGIAGMVQNNDRNTIDISSSS